MYEKRLYRNLLRMDNLVSFTISVNETDLLIHSSKYLEEITKKAILLQRGYIEEYIKKYPEFLNALSPLQVNGSMPLIIRDMASSGLKAGVGPMAAVAGAIAENVGTELLAHSDEIVVENGGDLFIKTYRPVTVGIFAGKSPLSMRIGLRIDSKDRPVGVCTSSGTVGPSLSFGQADAVSVTSYSCSLADAAATSIGNLVGSKNDIQSAIDFGKKIEGIHGIVIIIDDKMGIWGDINIVPVTAG